jgi:D-3-phosphoglycerate dehydrogenase
MNMRDVLVTENIDGSEMKEMMRSLDVAWEPELWKSPAKLRQAVGEFRAIIVRNQTNVDAELIAAGKQMLVIARAGVGLDNVDVKAASESGIVVVWTPVQNGISVAELTIALMLSAARMIPAADRSARAGKWERQRFMGTELYGKTLGIVGLGRIGRMVAARARAFGMEILAHDAMLKPDSPAVADARAKLVGFDELLAGADVVSCHVPKTAETIGMFDYATFCRMKRGAIFINTSRGEVVNEAGLIRALRGKKIAAAALDVREIEPPAAGELSEMDNVILTPHIAAFTHEGQKRVVASVCRDVADVLRGGEAKNYFNFARPKRA